jgi:alpha-beta hydrolase superfamily lysophospholipase
MTTPTTPTSWDLEGARGRVTVHDWINDAARYVVALAHGLGEHARRYDHVADHLVRHGAEVAAPDHRGHGRSEGEPGLLDDVESLVTDFAAVVDELTSRRPELPLVVIGHSMGGLVATRYVQRHPGTARALVLSGPVIGGNDALLGLLELAEMPEVPIDPAVLSRDPAVGRAYAEDPLVYHGSLRRGTLVGLRDSVEAVARGGDLGATPTLWLHGAADELVPVAETRRAFEVVGGDDLEEIHYPGARHEVFNETNRDEVLADVTAFIDRVLR